jgi:hypothetical protein
MRINMKERKYIYWTYATRRHKSATRAVAKLKNTCISLMRSTSINKYEDSDQVFGACTSLQFHKPIFLYELYVTVCMYEYLNVIYIHNFENANFSFQE